MLHEFAETGVIFAIVFSINPITSDRLDGTSINRLETEIHVFFRHRLPVNKGMSSVIVAGEEVGSVESTHVAVDALIIDVKCSGGVLGVSVLVFCHSGG